MLDDSNQFRKMPRKNDESRIEPPQQTNAEVKFAETTARSGDIVVFFPWLKHSTENLEDGSLSINGDVRPKTFEMVLPGFCKSMHSVPHVTDEL